MRKLVSTTLIMLSVVLLLIPGGKVTVSSVHATENLLVTSPKPTPAPHLPSGDDAICTEIDKGYSSAPLRIAEEQRRGLITTEIIAQSTDGVTEESNQIEPEAEVMQVASTTPDVIATEAATPSSGEVIPSQAPQAGSSGVLNAERLFSLVNATRAQAGLPAFQKHEAICAVAQSRGPELDNEIYGTSYMHAGFKARNLPYWATENMISQHTEEEALAWWMHSPVHRSAILGNYTYACTVCQGKSCAMIFSNLTPKVTVN